ncbi:MAG: phosphotransferase [Candidatus Kerfeldbacteria bacterium]
MADPRIRQIERYIKTINPKLLGLTAIGEVHISGINRGGYNLNYRVDIDGRLFVFRLNLDAYLDVENQTVYERDVMRAVEPAGIAPKVFFIDTKKDVLEHDLLVEEFLEHKPIRFGIEFLDEAGTLLKRLHVIPLPAGTGLIRNTDSFHDQWKFIQKKIAFIKAHNIHSGFVESFTQHAPKIEAYVSQHAYKFRGDGICINHGDPVIENFLSTGKGLRLVDWQAAMADDPSYDLALFTCPIMVEWNLGRHLSTEEEQAFFRGYNADEALLEKIRMRQPMVNLEIVVWCAYRAAYLRNKIDTNGAHKEDAIFFKKRFAAYEKFLDKKRIMRYLEVFYDHA